LVILERLAPVAEVGLTRADDRYAVKVNLQAPPPDNPTLPSVEAGVPVRVELDGAIREA
jgi:hypothetical protein